MNADGNFFSFFSTLLNVCFSEMVVDRSTSEALFKKFTSANTFTAITESFQLLCNSLDIDAKEYNSIYQNLKALIRTDEAVSLWKLLDNRAKQQVYEDGHVCSQNKVEFYINLLYGYLI